MNFLKSLSNSIIGPSLPYTIHADNSTTSIPSNTLWKINDGSRKSDNLPVTIFQYNKSPANAGSQRGDVLNYINNATMAFKSLRLPNLIQTLDVIEESEIVYVITERVRSLNQILNEGSLASMLDAEEGKLLLLYQVLKGLKYLNVEGGSILGRLGLENVYLTDTGVWKLGGFELLTNKKTASDGFMLIKNGGEQRFREERAIIATECQQNSGRDSRVEKLDTFKFGVFIYRIFNLQDGPDGFSLEDVSLGKNVPQFLRSELKKLITPSLTVRPSIEQLWAKWEPQFSDYELIQLSQRFEEYSFISDPEEKYHVLLQTAKSGSRFPRGFQEYKILPELVKYYDTNQTNFDTLQLILTSHQSHQQDQSDQIFNNAIKPTVFKAFMVPDRTIRLLLLTHLPAILPKLTASEINDKIFPNYLTGFQDSNVKIREESLKQLRGLVPLLYSRQLNNEVLRTLAKLQTDDSKEIKTLTTITLASIAESLDQSTRANVLAIAFTKSLRDSGNEENQTAALLAILSSLDLFSAEIITTKILTVIAPALLEKNVKVRTLAQKVFKVFLEKVYEEVRKLSTEQESGQPHVEEEQDLSIIEQNLRDEFEMLTVKLDPLPPATPDISRSTSSSHVNLSKTQVQKPSSGAATAATRSVKGSFHLDHKIQSNDSLVNLITDTTKSSTKKQHPAPISSGWSDDEDLLINDDDDGWGQDDNGQDDEDAWIEPAPIVKKTTVIKPKVTRTVTKTSTASTAADSNLAAKPKKLGGSTGGGLKLQPKKKLQMKKVISFDPKDDDGDDAGWGDDGW
ncbi:hypothetical protein WICPIJ_002941 [Wickerhamomyces pijperi]|uniref:Protein kinase domain-containing protein n=1 Tax=Wickerhamomyces pijperi TaxID=599730 RepID=A0A9P8QAN6_WICPI|nr:hypothetical protein WICPIJ_002941 [Wickerhamomyces pijperi]